MATILVSRNNHLINLINLFFCVHNLILKAKSELFCKSGSRKTAANRFPDPRTGVWTGYVQNST